MLNLVRRYNPDDWLAFLLNGLFYHLNGQLRLKIQGFL